MRRALIPILVLATAFGCAKNSGELYLRAKSAGDRAYTAGRFEEAARVRRTIKGEDDEGKIHLTTGVFPAGEFHEVFCPRPGPGILTAEKIEKVDDDRCGRRHGVEPNIMPAMLQVK